MPRWGCLRPLPKNNDTVTNTTNIINTMKMKQNYKVNNLRFAISKSKFNASHVSDMIFRKEGRPMMNHLLRMVPLLGGKLSRNWAKTCFSFLKQLNLLHKHQGIKGTVKYLKICSVCLQQVCAGYRLPCLNPLGMRISRSRSGLPRIIPAHHRKMIRAGDVVVTRFWMTCFSLYRDFHFVGELKLSTITDPSTATSRASEVSRHLKSFITLYYKDQDRTFSKPGSVFQILKSGPQSTKADNEFSTHPRAVLRSLILLLKPSNSHLREALVGMLEYTNSLDILKMFHDFTDYFGNKLKPMYVWDRSEGRRVDKSDYKPRSRYLGRLSIKEEAAGKVRVFAMVDCWTQWALKPLHKKLFAVLSRMPQDGTFDQGRALRRVPFGKAPIYSFDLSAATDRLPLSLQKELLACAYSPEMAQNWATLMVGRDYKTPSEFLLGGIKRPDNYPSSVRYAVGQPMGALSSWAMLAITHHYILHYCAWTSSVKPVGEQFLEYSVLGDDIIIWNRRVAKRYLSVMRSIGVGIGIAKSIISEKGIGLEFAKRTVVRGVDVSPIPFTEQSAAHRSMAPMIQFAHKYKLSALKILRFLGYGYKVDPTKPSRVVKAIDTALSIPRTYKDLLLLFSTRYGYMDWKLEVSFPRSYVKRQLVSLVGQEVGNLIKEIRRTKFSLLMIDGSAQVSGIGPWRTEISVLQARMMESYSTQYLKVLVEHEMALTGLLHINSDIIEFYKGIYYDIPYTERQKLEPFPASWITLVARLFKAKKDLDEIQLDRLTNPKVSLPASPSYLEEARTIRLWNRWSKTLLQSGRIQGVAIKKLYQ